MNRAKAHRLERSDGSLVDQEELGDVTMDSDEGSVPFSPPARGRGRGGRGRGGRGRGRGESNNKMQDRRMQECRYATMQ